MMKDQSKAFRASKLEDWEIQAAKKLKELFDQADISQKMFGATWGIGTGGMVSQYVNAKRPLGLQAAIKFAKGLKVSVAEISPTLAAQLPQPNGNPVETLAQPQGNPLSATQPLALVACGPGAMRDVAGALRMIATVLHDADPITRKQALPVFESLVADPAQVEYLIERLQHVLQPPKQANGR